MTGARILVESLLAHGVDRVFGLPGASVLEIYDELYRYADCITHVLTSHEQGAAHAADGYARASGRTGVVLATSGPGATNLITGIATAFMDSVPLIAITGNVPLSRLGRDSFQETDITGITIPITKHNFIVKDVNDLESILCQAFMIAQSGRPGPVLVDIPNDVARADCKFQRLLPLAPKRPAPPSISRIREATALISKSKRPLVLAGGGIISSNATDELAHFVNIIDAPVITSLMGTGSFSAENPRYLGMIGMYGSRAALMAAERCDLLVVVGARFSDRLAGDAFSFAQNADILHIDIDLAEIDKNVNTHFALVGDAFEVLRLLSDNLSRCEHLAWVSEMSELARPCAHMSQTLPERDLSGLSSSGIVSALARHLPDACIVTDVGQHQIWTAQSFSFRFPRTFISSGGLGAMGFGLGAAIGAAMSDISRRVVLVTGDGSFHMNMGELATAVSYNLPIIVVVMNNGSLGLVRQLQTFYFGGRHMATTLNRSTDFLGIAYAMGADGSRAENAAQLEQALQAAVCSDRPYVIDCFVDIDEQALPLYVGADIEPLEKDREET